MSFKGAVEPKSGNYWKTCTGAATSSKWNPKFKGCGRKLKAKGNFEPMNRSKDGYRNTCNKCMPSYDAAKQKFLEAKEKKTGVPFNTRGKKAVRKAVQKVKKQQPKKPPMQTIEQPIKQLEYPNVDINIVKTLKSFDVRYEPYIKNLNQLHKFEENMIVFLHSIVTCSGADNWADKNELAEMIQVRFRTLPEMLPNLKVFTGKANIEEWIERKQLKVGWDDKRDSAIMKTTHFALTQSGVDWINLWVESNNEIPSPIVPPDSKKKLKPISGHVGAAKPEQLNLGIDQAFYGAQSEKDMTSICVEFIVKYKAETGYNNAMIAKRLGCSTGPVYSILNNGSISARTMERVKELMKLNPNLFSNDKRFDVEVQEERRMNAPLAPLAIEPTPEAEIDFGVDSMTPKRIEEAADKFISWAETNAIEAQAYRLAIEKTEKQLDKATAAYYAAKCKMEMVQHRLDWLKAKLV